MNQWTAPHTIELGDTWAFAYIDAFDPDSGPTLLPVAEARCAMPVPGFWDDHIDAIKAAGFGDQLRFNPEHETITFPQVGLAPDASLPNIVGLGQYEQTFEAPQNARLTFESPPTFIEAWLWINGQRVAHQPHYSTPWQVPIDSFVKPGVTNRISLQVTNLRPKHKGCITRGFKGYSAGIVAPIRLRVTGPARLADCFVYSDSDREQLNWRITIDCPTQNEKLELAWRVVDRDTGEVVIEATQGVTHGENTWKTSASNLQTWSDRCPKLYNIECSLRAGDEVSDTRAQTFGLRTIESKSFALELNSQPIFLRGATEHAYYPETCTIPLDKRTHRDHIAKLKAIGFNWLRFHTWVPTEAYLEAADELGMLIQVEPPVGADDAHWAAILRACRRHPSVVIYCGGNEQLLDEAKLDQLEHWAHLRRELAPDALFSPHEALRGIEYGWNDEDLGEDAVHEPYIHNPRRLERIKKFSDCFGQFTWGWMSYNSNAGNAKTIDQRLEPYQRPCLTHELAIHGSYIDLDLEHRYQGTRIGTGMYASIREHLRGASLEHRAATYYNNSCAWMRRLRKQTIETARLCQRLAGYDMLGAIDHHWHRTGYPCGIMNEFYELKPGETPRDVLQYNGQSVLLLDHENTWTFAANETWRATLYASIFDEMPLGEAKLSWALRDQQGHVYAQDAREVSVQAMGRACELSEVKFDAPQVDRACALTLEVQLQSASLQIKNDWPLWVYPQVSCDAQRDGVRVTDALSSQDIDALEAGAHVLLLSARPFPSRITVDQIACAGRAEGNLATVIHDHPITHRLPHAGYCDWDFHRMIDLGEAVLIDALDIPFDPIIEVVSSFKHACKQTALFELSVGEGRLLVCSLGMQADDPAAMYLRKLCIDYLASPHLAAAPSLQVDALRKLLADAPKRETLNETDQGFDERAALTSW